MSKRARLGSASSGKAPTAPSGKPSVARASKPAGSGKRSAASGTRRGAKAVTAKSGAGKSPRRVSGDGGRYSQSLSHGLAVLASFDAEHSTLGIAEMAALLSMSRSTTHRYATTLAELGYLEQDSSRRYRLTSHAADLGLSALRSMTLRKPARVALYELREQTGRSVSLGVLAGTDALLVDRLRGWRGLHKLDLRLGPAARLPLHCAAIGKALLACLPEPERRQLIATLVLARQGPNCITGKRALREELERTWQLGFAIDDEEYAAGVRSIAVPVLDRDGLALAAVNLAVPAQACSPEELHPRYGAALGEAATAVAASL